MKHLLLLLVLPGLMYVFCSDTPTSRIEAAGPTAIVPTPVAWPTKTPIPKIAKTPEPDNARKMIRSPSTKPQGMGPTAIASTKDGQYAYVSFHLSDVVLKVRLADLTVEAEADLSQYFPLQSYRIALDASEKKLFVHSSSWKKIIVLNTQTMSVIHTIDNIVVSGIIRSQYEPFPLIIWGDEDKVKFVNTETYVVTEMLDPSIWFLQIRESRSDQGKWYAATQGGPGGPWIVGLYDNVAKSWIRTVTIPLQGATPGIMDLYVLPNERKVYVGVNGGWYQENHSYGWVYSVDLTGWQVKEIPIDGGAWSLGATPDSQRLYVGVSQPSPNDVNNIQVINVQSDTIVGAIQLGRNRYNWAYGEIRYLQIDSANPRFLYATSNDANALIKADLDSQTLAGVLVFNEESLRPHFFVKRPTQSTGYILIHQSANTFELDLDKATVNKVATLPGIRADAYSYDVAITDAGRMLVAQGETFLEIDAATMSLLGTHPLPPGTSLWRFVLSNDRRWIYSVTQDGPAYQPNVFLAIDRASFQVQARFKLDGGVFEERPFELPDGSKLYAVGGFQNGAVTIHVIRTDNFTIQKTLTFQEPGLLEGISAGPYYPYAYDSSSRTLFVGATNVVLAIDTVNDTIKKVIYLRDIATAIGLEPYPWIFVYVNVIGLVYQPQENYLYMTHLDRAFVSIYDLTNNRFLPRVIPLKGYFPWFVFANDAYSKIFVLNTRSDNVSVIDVNSKTMEKVIDLHDHLKQLYLPIILRSTR